MQLGYWKIQGRTQPIRMLLAYLKADYKENNPNAKEWFKNRHKMQLNFPDLPYLIDGDMRMTETTAIVDYLLHKYDKSYLLGKDPMEKIHHRMIFDVLFEIFERCFMVIYSKDYKKRYSLFRYICFEPKLKYLS